MCGLAVDGGGDSGNEQLSRHQVGRDWKGIIVMPGKYRSPSYWQSLQIMLEHHSSECMVYIVEAIGTGNVKIGSSIHWLKRIKELQNMMPVALRVLVILPGGQPKVKQLHRQFAMNRIRRKNEWFRMDGELLTFIREAQLAVARKKGVAADGLSAAS